MQPEAVRHAPVVVSLTTIPSRIDHIRPTLESLLAGTLVPDLILVSTTTFCELENSGYRIPAFLTDPQLFDGRVRHVECRTDWGPGTKILGPLPHLPAECILVIADDDIVYHPDFLNNLVEAQRASSNSSYSFYVYRAMGLAVGQGCDGLSVWSPHLQGIENFAENYVFGTTLLYHDDVWISFFLAAKGIAMRRLAVPADVDLVYEQMLPNTVLSSLAGDLKRELILSTHLPRLLRETNVSLLFRARLRALASFDRIVELTTRGAQKLARLANAGRSVANKDLT